MSSSSQINKIHVNSTTKISLNDRFTVMQTVAPTNGKNDNTGARNPDPVGRRRRSQSLPRNNGGPPPPSAANRKFLEQLEKKHKIQAALKLKRRSLKASAMLQSSNRGRRNAGRRRRKIEQIAYRLGPNGRLIRSNNLANIATMNADFSNSRIPAAARLRRSNSTANLSAIGINRRRNSLGNTNSVRGGQRRRSLSRSRLNLMETQGQRGRPQNNLKRSNSRTNLLLNGGPNQLQRQGRSRSRSRNPTQNNRMRSASRSNQNLNVRQRLPVQSRLGIRSNNPIGNRVGRNGRIVKGNNTRNNKFAGGNNRGNDLRQGRVSRTRGRIARIVTGRRGRSRSRGDNIRKPQNQNGRTGGLSGRGSNRSRGTFRGSSRFNRGNTRQAKPEVKREDLDKELDAYMSSPKDV